MACNPNPSSLPPEPDYRGSAKRHGDPLRIPMLVATVEIRKVAIVRELKKHER